jgi:hypothetical protein
VICAWNIFSVASPSPTGNFPADLEMFLIKHNCLVFISAILLMVRKTPVNYVCKVFSEAIPMKLTNNKFCTTSILSGLLLATVASAAIVRPAQAGPFDFLNGINNTINQVNGTVNGVRDVHGNTNSTLSNLGGLGNLLGIGSSSTSSNDIRDVYASWYGTMSSAEKEVVKVLVNEFAEDKVSSFAEFKKIPEYSRLSAPAKATASSIFFKFKEVSKAAQPQKDNFLAFAFCMNGGAKKCK